MEEDEETGGCQSSVVSFQPQPDQTESEGNSPSTLPFPKEEGAGEETGFPRETFLGLLRSGLWPATALAYLGVSRAEWREERARDAKLTAEVAKAIAAFEMIHIRNLHTKIQEADWRGSAWWLAQRFPKRYGGGHQTREAERAVDEILGVLDRALRNAGTPPASSGTRSVGISSGCPFAAANRHGDRRKQSIAKRNDFRAIRSYNSAHYLRVRMSMCGQLPLP
jgi:hypothetical protein